MNRTRWYVFQVIKHRLERPQKNSPPLFLLWKSRRAPAFGFLYPLGHFSIFTSLRWEILTTLSGRYPVRLTLLCTFWYHAVFSLAHPRFLRKILFPQNLMQICQLFFIYLNTQTVECLKNMFYHFIFIKIINVLLINNQKKLLFYK